MKKILIFMIVFIFGNIFLVNADLTVTETRNENWKTTSVTTNYNWSQVVNTTTNTVWNAGVVETSCPSWSCSWNVEDPKKEVKETPKKCTWENCLNSPNYMFPTSEFVPGGTFKWWKDTQEKVENWLVKIIQNLMIPFWVLATIIMTIWAWYMVLHNWDDEMLNKWKKIFKMWIISIVIALSSYLLVELLKNLLYA